ncbi:chromosome partitioning protein [Intrasporangium oryzae NRRL B-24470]|uniref:Chromosome partitioning protein n=1 Tax=Intrasporangium oryzae NRRL B-24470 TaxID=1386089 RepID=W9GEN1_9MICO|nr:AAA family ATPase [Intrasporangium oryzae]EWT03677.1 chromosome partitioning protein [Intrasporangium oryzae NRRL B-24470]
MTILWDLDPRAHSTYRFALGADVEQIFAPAQIGRALQDNPNHHLVVIGPDIPIEQACSIAELERVDRPELGVILLRHRVDVNALAQALRAGVREVVQVDDQPALSEAVRRSLALTEQLRGNTSGASASDGKVLTVFSAKGGVGKTTLATNIAAYLASTGARTLLVDVDLMFGDVAISLQLVPDRSMSDVAAMRGRLDAPGLKSVVSTHPESGLDVIPAPADPGDADRIPAVVVEELIRVARGEYDYIVIDTPPNLTEHVLTACDFSDLTILIATLDIPAVKNLRLAMNTLDTLGASKEARTIVLNRSDAKVGLRQEDVEAALKYPISATVPTSSSVPATVNRGVVVVLDEPRSPVAAAFREVVDREIRQRFGEEVDTGGKRSFGLRRSRK